MSFHMTQNDWAYPYRDAFYAMAVRDPSALLVCCFKGRGVGGLKSKGGKLYSRKAGLTAKAILCYDHNWVGPLQIKKTYTVFTP